MTISQRLLYSSLLLGMSLPVLPARLSTAEAADETAAESSRHAAIIAACVRECESCSDHCAKLLESGKKEHRATEKSCRDCAEICAAALRIVSRHGPMSSLITEACARACEQCAKQCEKAPDDPHMKACAKACRECATACRELSSTDNTTAR